jgi:fumarate reductase flavoprotein subunit
MQRRQFLKSSALAAASLPALGIARAAAAGLPTYDLIVVGAGTAGLPAAIFASRRGARVLLVDAASAVGGTLHLANGQVAAAGTRLQQSLGIADTPDAHFDDVMRLSRGMADRELVRRTVDEAPATINWLLDAGLVPLPGHPVTGDSPGRPAYGTPRYLWAEEQGRAILAVIERELAPELASGRVVTQLRTRVTGLITTAAGAVEGIEGIVAADAGGEPRLFQARARHVLLASGGYAMNPELFQRLCGHPPYVASSYPYSQGDGLELATSVGGWLRGRELHRPGSGSILTSDRYPAKVYARFVTSPQQRPPWEIWVNDEGRRYIREDEPVTYARERALLRQPRLRYAVVFDAEILRQSPPGVAGWSREQLASHFDTHPMFLRADSLEALAKRAEIAPVGLLATVAEYNQAVKSGRDALGRSHLPLPIVKPPFHAVILHGHSATSSAGVVVDGNLRVMRGDGRPVPNLYAAGEILGSGSSLGDAFVPGMMLTPALSLGRWLGRTLPLGAATA